MSEQNEETPLARVERLRAERKAAAQKAHDAQLAVDLEAIDLLEAEHGDSNVGVIRVGHTAGLPAAVACRCPKPVELKRFRALVTPKNDRDRPDNVAPAEQLGRVCLIYPDAETFAKLCDARPGLQAQLGKAAIELAVGAEEREGKD